MFEKKSTKAWLLQVATFVADELHKRKVRSTKLIFIDGRMIYLNVCPVKGKDYQMMVLLDEKGTPIHARIMNIRKGVLGEFNLVVEEKKEEEEFGV